MPEYIGCTVKELPEFQRLDAARTAINHNPANRPRLKGLAALSEQLGVSPPAFLAILTSKYWGSGGVKLSVSFLDNPAPELRDRLLSHMNAWNKYCNCSFKWSQSGGQVRIYRGGDGYWSYLGTDITHIPAGQPTMNLQGFTMQTPESEYHRVVRHETGHTLGFPHEHMRREIINRLDRTKTIVYFRQNQGWDTQTTLDQVLTPIDESSIMGTPHADETSIMCYGLPAQITRDGHAIPGGTDINESDAAFAAKLYPLAVVPPVPPVPPKPNPEKPTMDAAAIKALLVKYLGVASFIARWTPTSVDDQVISILMKDEVLDVVCAVLAKLWPHKDDPKSLTVAAASLKAAI